MQEMRGNDMRIQQRLHKRESGAVSLFIVIFATLLITILTVSFIRLMLHDQQQATNNDLSQSAYDSALAGVEDAKRALIACQNGSVQACTGIDSNACDSLTQAGVSKTSAVSGSNKETQIQTLQGDATTQLDQAYTCVKVTRKTDDYIGQLKSNASDLINLKGVSTFDTIKLQWFQYTDFETTKPSAGRTLSYYNSGAQALPKVVNWPQDSPPVMRAQLIQYDAANGFKLSDFDDQPTGSGAHTLFLYPMGPGSGIGSYSFIRDARSQASAPLPVTCVANLAAGGYACSVTLTLPNPVTTAGAAYLRLSSLYNGSHYSLSLANGNSLVQIDGQQPIVDSTGRANDIFRRVQSRVKLSSDFPYPDAAVDITGNLCKNFTITNNVSDYRNACAP
jgi:Tfp pilus assembly protein PilX